VRGAIAGTVLLLCGASASNAADIALFSYPLPPFVVETNGQFSGPVPKVVAELRKAAGLSETPTSVPVARLLTDVEAGDAMGFPLARNPQREPKFEWIVKLYDDAFAFATLKPRAAVNTLDEGRALGSITVNNASAPKNLLTAAGGFNNLDSANSELQNASKLYNGNVDAWFSVASGFRPISQGQGLDPTQLVIGAAAKVIEVYLIGSHNLPPAVIEKMRQRFDAMKANGEYDAIMGPTLAASK